MGAEAPLKLLKVSEVAERLRVSPFTVYRRIEAGQLRALRLGTSPNAPLRVDEVALAELLHTVVDHNRDARRED